MNDILFSFDSNLATIKSYYYFTFLDPDPYRHFRKFYNKPYLKTMILPLIIHISPAAHVHSVQYTVCTVV